MQKSSLKLPLAVAVINDDVITLDNLLCSGTDVNEFSYFRGHGEAPLLTAVRYARFDMVRSLLGHGANVNQTSSRGHTPLLRASQRNYFSMLCELLKHGAHVNATDNEGRDALFWAVKSRNINAVKKLVENGARVNSEFNASHPKPSVLHLAAASPNILEYLLDAGAEVNAVDDCGETPLFSAVRVDNYHNVMMLLEKGAVVNAINQDQRTPLHLAAASVNNSVAVAELLLSHGVFVNSLDRYLNTPLVLTLRSYILQRNDSVIRHLIQHGSDLRYELCADGLQWTVGANLELLKFAVLAGFKLSKASWVCRFLVEMKLDQPRYQLFQNDVLSRAAAHYITEQLKYPRDLGAICRVAIRERLIDVSPGCTIFRSIDQLPIPETLKLYLKLTDV